MSVAVHIWRSELAIVFESTGNCALGGVFGCAGQESDSGGVDIDGDATALGHFAKVADESEAGDVGAAVDVEREHRFAGGAVESQHGFDHGVDMVVCGDAFFEGGSNDACANRFREKEDIPGLGAGVGFDLLRMDCPGNGVSELDFGIVHAVSADENAAGLVDLFRAASEDFREIVEVTSAGITEDGERGEGFAAHGVDVAKGIRRGDRAEGVRVVDNGGKEVDGLHEGALLRELVDAGVVRRVEAHEEIRIRKARNAAEHLVQNLWTQFRCSTSRLHMCGQLLRVFLRIGLLGHFV